jgi:hypothetical protein
MLNVQDMLHDTYIISKYTGYSTGAAINKVVLYDTAIHSDMLHNTVTYILSIRYAA